MGEHALELDGSRFNNTQQDLANSAVFIGTKI
jgi:hypothetical protein